MVTSRIMLVLWYNADMTLEDRILEVEQKFNTKQAERDKFLKDADERLEEMHRLQGEYRALTTIKDDPATTITAKPEKEKK